MAGWYFHAKLQNHIFLTHAAYQCTKSNSFMDGGLLLFLIYDVTSDLRATETAYSIGDRSTNDQSYEVYGESSVR